MNPQYVDGKAAGEIARGMREGLAAAQKGVRIKTWWGDDGKSADQLRAWFRDKLDGMINLKAGLRSDGAPARDRQRCFCRGCVHAHMHDLDRPAMALDRTIIVRCPSCPRDHIEYGGRKRESEYESGAHRDQWRLRDKRERRIIIHQFETAEVRERFGHLISDRY